MDTNYLDRLEPKQMFEVVCAYHTLHHIFTHLVHLINPRLHFTQYLRHCADFDIGDSANNFQNATATLTIQEIYYMEFIYRMNNTGHKQTLHRFSPTFHTLFYSFSTGWCGSIIYLIKSLTMSIWRKIRC